MIKRKLSESKKKEIAGRQRYKCANRPNSKLKGIGDYNVYCGNLKEMIRDHLMKPDMILII